MGLPRPYLFSTPCLKWTTLVRALRLCIHHYSLIQFTCITSPLHNIFSSHTACIHQTPAQCYEWQYVLLLVTASLHHMSILTLSLEGPNAHCRQYWVLQWAVCVLTCWTRHHAQRSVHSVAVGIDFDYQTIVSTPPSVPNMKLNCQ